MSLTARYSSKAVSLIQSLGTRYMPFADAATVELPLGRLLRLSLFQVTAGMAAALLTGTLNRVMILELGVATSLVAIVVALPVLIAPFRVLIGHRSDTYRSVLGWRRVPYVWLGTLLQFGGLAIMPFALLLLQSQTVGPSWAGPLGVALAFLLTGGGMHVAQTAGLALATDLAPAQARPRVVALLYVMLLVGMIGSSLVFSFLLDGFTPKRLIQVIQGAAVVTIVLNVISLWKQEARNPALTAPHRERTSFKAAGRRYAEDRSAFRLLLAVGLGSAAFSMQDVLLEPYGGEILGLSVSQTTLLTALWAAGTLVGLSIAARLLSGGINPHRISAIGALTGVFAFSGVVFAGPMQMDLLFRLGTTAIGCGGGLFAVGTMLAAMEQAERSDSGFAVGAWSAVQATAIGLALAAGGIIKDAVNSAALSGALGEAMSGPSSGYIVVYHLEIGLLFVCMAVLGPLAGRRSSEARTTGHGIGLADLPG